jgi:hypothetical protein
MMQWNGTYSADPNKKADERGGITVTKRPMSFGSVLADARRLSRLTRAAQERGGGRYESHL